MDKKYSLKAVFQNATKRIAVFFIVKFAKQGTATYIDMGKRRLESQDHCNLHIAAATLYGCSDD